MQYQDSKWTDKVDLPLKIKHFRFEYLELNVADNVLTSNKFLVLPQM